jgi:predicted NAD-dependent protein-ADP-ribosyltransferase YbiA (DUF1768 family)
MARDDPAEIKHIGKSIATGDGEWNKHIEAHAPMRKGLHAKFFQNSYRNRVPLNTGDEILLESNPHHSVRGIGLNRNHPKASK